FDARARPAACEAKRQRVAHREPRGVGHDRAGVVALPHDRVAAGETGERRERLQTDRRALDLAARVPNAEREGQAEATLGALEPRRRPLDGGPRPAPGEPGRQRGELAPVPRDLLHERAARPGAEVVETLGEVDHAPLGRREPAAERYEPVACGTKAAAHR